MVHEVTSGHIHFGCVLFLDFNAVLSTLFLLCYTETMKKYLDEQLISYSKADYYPFHMPGHKRQRLGEWVPEEIDITEIDGFDNLHHAEGIIKEGQERLAELVGADQSFYLVNGSTAGLLSAICGSVKKGDRILVGRNSHKAVYHAVYLMELKVEYLYPEPTAFGIQGSISPEQVERKLKRFPDVAAVVITSPTYDGVVSDIASIAAIVHGYEIPLIVDEAHGAHFGFSEGFPKKAIALGADLCIESLHKTLPSYTQTAVLHVMKARDIRNRHDFDRISKVSYQNEYRVDVERVKRYLGIYQSSSPSYVLMAGIDRCVRMLQQDAALYKSEDTKEASLFGAFEQRLREFYRACSEFRYVQVFPYIDVKYLYIERERSYWAQRTESRECTADMDTGIWAKDNSKILISAERAGLHGQQLYDLLLHKYHLQMEMASGHYVTAITTIMDTEEGFKRLLDALREIDLKAAGQQMEKACATGEAEGDGESGNLVGEAKDDEKSANLQNMMANDTRFTPLELYQPREKQMEIAQAMDSPKLEILLEDAAGYISGEFIYLYPPGIPMIAPGEVITKGMLRLIDVCRQRNMQIQGMLNLTGENVQVVYQKNRFPS